MRVAIYILLFTMVLGSCSPRLNPDQYRSWVKDSSSGLYQKKEAAGLKFLIAYKTPDFLYLQENQKENLCAKALKAREVQLNEDFHFNLSYRPLEGNNALLRSNLESDSEYYARVNYFSFEHSRDLSLVIDGKDTLKPSSYHFARTYTSSPNIDMIVSFEKKKVKDNITLIITDPVFSQQEIEFTIQASELNAIPGLKI